MTSNLKIVALAATALGALAIAGCESVPPPSSSRTVIYSSSHPTPHRDYRRDGRDHRYDRGPDRHDSHSRGPDRHDARRDDHGRYDRDHRRHDDDDDNDRDHRRPPYRG